MPRFDEAKIGSNCPPEKSCLDHDNSGGCDRLSDLICQIFRHRGVLCTIAHKHRIFGAQVVRRQVFTAHGGSRRLTNFIAAQICDVVLFQFPPFGVKVGRRM
jgi:hypothetical protein